MSSFCIDCKALYHKLVRDTMDASVEGEPGKVELENAVGTRLTKAAQSVLDGGVKRFEMPISDSCGD